MALSLPNDIFGTAFQRLAYNIDLIEKRYANKRPCGLELDVDTGKIVQVVDAKRPRLTAEEAKEKMRKTFLAPQSLLGNSSLCSPFVNEMNVSRETKLRVLKHNKRFKQQLENGTDCATFLNDENDAATNKEENDEEEELVDMDDVLDEVEYNDNEDDDDDDDEEEEGAKNELSEDEEDLGPSDEQELEAELEKQKENEEELSFEEPEEEATNEENTYKNVKITRALIQRLTPKVARKAKKAASTKPTKSTPAAVGEETPKATRGRKSLATLKEQNQEVESTPQVSKKITKSLSAKAASKTKTPTVSKDKEAASEKAISKKNSDTAAKITRRSSAKAVAENSTSSTASKITSGRSRNSMPLIKASPFNNRTAPSRSASTGKKITKPASEKAATINTTKTSAKKNASVKLTSNTSTINITTKKIRGRQSIDARSVTVSKEFNPSTVSKDKKVTKTTSIKAISKKDTSLVITTSKATEKEKKIAKSAAENSASLNASKNTGGPLRKSMPLIKATPSNNRTAPSRSASTGKKIVKATSGKSATKKDKTSEIQETPRLSSRGRSIIPTKRYKF